MAIRQIDAARGSLYARLLQHGGGDANDAAVARMISSWHHQLGVLPDWMGLGYEQFSEMVAFHFPGFDQHQLLNPGRTPDYARFDEREDLQKLLLADRANRNRSELWVASLLVNGCLGYDHLWQDVGLWSRPELSALIALNFPPLAERNGTDMKWKNFLYKQLCIAEGIYICRAPSCDQCSDYERCFGPED